MKKISLNGYLAKCLGLIISICLFVNFLGCAQYGPSLASPKVYLSAETRDVAKNTAIAEAYSSQTLDQQLAQKRAEARHQNAMKEIAGGKKELASDNGFVIKGGFPVVIINDSTRNKTFIIRKIEGVMRGHDFPVDVAKYKFEEIFLETGKYVLVWTNEGYSTEYPQKDKGPAILTVASDPFFHFNRTKKVYNGWFRVYGNQ